MDLSKLTPAPWEADGYHGEDGWDVGVEDSDGVSLRPLGTGFRKDDAEFIALARNAFDVMVRRGWTATLIDTQCWRVDVGIRGQRSASFDDPFTALVDADEWYREHVEKGGQ